MGTDLEFLRETDLFVGMRQEDIRRILKCSGAVVKQYEKGKTIFRESEKIRYIYVLLFGKLLMYKHLPSGRRNIICEIHEKEIFGILIRLSAQEEYWYDAIAVTDCQVLCISWDFLFDFCDSSCEAHKEFIRNMVRAQADINVSLMKKLNVLSGITVEAKLGLLMLDLMDENGLVDFKMNREELADFLGITRPSLSRTLMQMQKKGLILVNRSYVKILDVNGLESVSVY